MLLSYADVAEPDSVEGDAGDAEHQPFAQTDDMRPGLGLEGLTNLQNFVKNGGVYIGASRARRVRDRFRR